MKIYAKEDYYDTVDGETVVTSPELGFSDFISFCIFINAFTLTLVVVLWKLLS